MKAVIYGILIAAALLVPTRPLELGKLKPVEVIRVEKRGEEILIETDTGDMGRGKTVNQAIWDLQETTAGTVYLDTAEYILLPGDETIIMQLTPYLRDTVRMCCWEGEMKMEEVAEYLNVHRPNVILKDYRMGTQLQMLAGEDGRLHLWQKNIERREKTT